MFRVPAVRWSQTQKLCVGAKVTAVGIRRSINQSDVEAGEVKVHRTERVMAAAGPRVVASSNRGSSFEISCGLTFFLGVVSGWRETGGNVFWLSSRCFYCIFDGRLAVVCETNLSKVSTRRRSFGGSLWWAKLRPA